MTKPQPSQPVFRAGNGLAIHVPAVAKAEKFYSKQPGFKVKPSSPEQISGNACAFTLWGNRDSKEPPSFSIDMTRRNL